MSLHRFVHIGDLHLGPNARNADRIAALDQIIAEQILQPVAAWLWPGDLNHGRMAIEDKNVLVQRVQRMANHAAVVICYGNHDLPGDLDFLEQLHAVWPIFVVARPGVIFVPLADGRSGPEATEDTAAIFVLPYPTRAGLVSAGVPSEQVVDAARQALDVIFMDAAEKLRVAAGGECIPLMIGHVNVAGAIVSTGQPNIGREIELDPLLIGRLQVGYVGLNHIHKQQFVSGAFYAGSCCRLDWGEVEPKSYNVLTADDKDSPVSSDWDFSVERRQLDVAPMYHVEGELTPDGFYWTCNDGGEAEQAGPGFFAGAEVRVRYRFNQAERSALDESAVRAPFAGAVRLELEPIAMRSRAVRAPEVVAAQTLDAKVEAFVRSAGLMWGPSLEAKLAALQGSDGAAFLTQVQNTLIVKAAAPELVEVSS